MTCIRFMGFLVKYFNCLLRVAQRINFSLYLESRLKSELVCCIIEHVFLSLHFDLDCEKFTHCSL